MAEGILGSPGGQMFSATWLEPAMVVDGRDDLPSALEIAIVPVTPTQAALTRKAFRDFGKGRHPASLNFGDCFSYALAAETGEPLLCRGEDFRQTDLEIVRP